MATTISLLLIAALAVLAAVRLQKIIRDEEEKQIPLLIHIPHSFIADGEKSQELTAELYRRLNHLKIPFSIEFVVEGIGTNIKTFLFIKRRHEKKVRSIIESLWPHAHAPEVDCYDLWGSFLEDSENNQKTRLAYLMQERPYAIPIHPNKAQDFKAILQYLSTLDIVGESVAIQYVVRPANSELVQNLSRIIENLNSGHFTHHGHLDEHFHPTPQNIRLLEEKIREPLLSITTRIVVTSHDKSQTEKIFKTLHSKFNQISSGAAYNCLGLKESDNKTEDFFQFLNQIPDPQEGIILNTAELAALAALHPQP